MAAEREFYVGQVVQYRPPVTGGQVVAVVTAVHNMQFGVSLDVRVTDGTRYWPTGCETAFFAEDVR